MRRTLLYVHFTMIFLKNNIFADWGKSEIRGCSPQPVKLRTNSPGETAGALLKKYGVNAC